MIYILICNYYILEIKLNFDILKFYNENIEFYMLDSITNLFRVKNKSDFNSNDVYNSSMLCILFALKELIRQYSY